MSSPVYDRVKQLTPKEQHYLAQNPHHAIAITRAYRTSVNEEKKYFGVNGWNNEADAFRHCIWSALLARDIGYFSALLFTNAHESGADNHPVEKDMDLHNNRVGLWIGATGGSDQALAHSCLAALRGGQLRIIPRTAI